MTCPTCNSKAHAILGRLGKIVWIRCRACGWTFGRKGRA